MSCRKTRSKRRPFCLYPFFAYVHFLAILYAFIRGRYLARERGFVMTGVEKEISGSAKCQERYDRRRTKEGNRRWTIKRRNGGMVNPWDRPNNNASWYYLTEYLAQSRNLMVCLFRAVFLCCWAPHLSLSAKIVIMFNWL